MSEPARNYKKLFFSSVGGTVLVALCCFTPLLVGVLGLFGLGLVIPYLDFVLLPALLVMIVVTLLAYRKWRRAQGEYDMHTRAGKGSHDMPPSSGRNI